jgi:hypothetical protein
VAVEGEPREVTICHCLACQRRTGSAFGMQAGFGADQVTVTGRYTDYTRISDEEDRRPHTFHFCPECGSNVFSTEPGGSDWVVVSVGSFADPEFPPPTVAGYGFRRHRWLELPESVKPFMPDYFAPAKPLYEAGAFDEAADRGREILEAHPDDPQLLYNLACCESRAGRTDDALEHLGRAVELAEVCRELAARDPDFEAIRSDPGFAAIVGG